MNSTSIATTIDSSISQPMSLFFDTLASNFQFPLPSTSTATNFATSFPMTGLPTFSTIPPNLGIDAFHLQPSLLPPENLLTTALANIFASVNSTTRRPSCPETSSMSLKVPETTERRRYSDSYSIETLLRDTFAPLVPFSLSSQMFQTFPLEQQNVEPQPSQSRRSSTTVRKQRTIYGSKQTEVLEEAFHSQKYMVGAEREELATRLGLTEAQVRVWFQNRRSKQRKLSKTSVDQ